MLKLIARQKTSREIGCELFISHRTVETHRSNICEKLELRGSLNAALSPGAETARSIPARSSGVTHSSESMEKTHSPVARASARFFCGPKPGQSGA